MFLSFFLIDYILVQLSKFLLLKITFDLLLKLPKMFDSDCIRQRFLFVVLSLKFCHNGNLNNGLIKK